jgi:hypothetical protein
MKITKPILILLFLIHIFVSCTNPKSAPSEEMDLQTLTEIPVLNIDFVPQKYVAYKAEKSINIDGELSEAEWGNIPWTSEFEDLQGYKGPEPLFPTKVKMQWDDTYFYFAAELIEPHIWASIKDHDDIVLYNNDFEIFMDPDGDTHDYCEIEMNAFTTIWDLILTRPYRDGPRVIDSWHVYGIKKAVKIYGTLNDFTDIDDKWTVEIAIPWKVLEELGAHGGAPANGEQWRVNFLRVNHQVDFSSGEYQRKVNPETNKPFGCYNWIWVASGEGCHAPEVWGFVQFSDKKVGNDTFVDDKNDEVKWALRELYYRQRAFKKEYGKYTAKNTQLKLSDVQFEGMEFNPEISLFNGRWEAKQIAFNNKIAYIRWDGKVWLE